MKAKVLMYGSGGNKVVRKYVELKETGTDNVYTHNEDGYDHLVYKYESNNVVFVEVCTIYGYESEDRKKQFKENYSLYLNSWKTHFASNILIEVHRDLGNDIEPIIQEREKQLIRREEERERKEKEAEDKRLEKQRIRLEEDLKAAHKIVEELKAGRKVSFGELIQAIDVLKIDVHPRTKGAMKKQNVHNRIGKESGGFDKGTRNSTVQSMFEVVAMIAS